MEETERRNVPNILCNWESSALKKTKIKDKTQPVLGWVPQKQSLRWGFLCKGRAVGMLSGERAGKELVERVASGEV